jgi:hypothetical protein
MNGQSTYKLMIDSGLKGFISGIYGAPFTKSSGCGCK